MRVRTGWADRYKDRFSHQEKVKFRFIKTWLGFSLFLLLYQFKRAGLPLYEGWVNQSGLIAGFVFFFIPLIWMAKPLAWSVFNVRNRTIAFEYFVGFLLFGLAAWFSLSAVKSLYSALAEDNTVVIITDDYSVQWYEDCGDRQNEWSCDFSGYFIALNGGSYKDGLEVNRSTYEWLRYHSYKKKVTENRNTRTVDVIKPISIKYKPKSKIVFNVEPVQVREHP